MRATNPEREERVHRARGMAIENECDRRGIQLRGRGHDRAGPCPKCGGTDRFSINTVKQVFRCRQCNEKGGDVISMVMWLDDCDFDAAVTTLVGEPQQKRANGHDKSSTARSPPTATWIYRDADGNPYLKVDRFDKPNDKKDYPQSRWNGSRWVPGAPKGPKIPYRLPELLDSDRTEPVYICEGEKCADAVAGLGLTATSASEGAGKWTADLSEWFRDRIVYILPDNDEPGAKHADQVARNLDGVARQVRIIEIPGLGHKDDVFDWIARGGTLEQLDKLGDAAPEFDAADAFWHGDVTPAESRPWLVYATIPETGAGLLSGQWGTFKTFTAIDLACAIMSGTPIFDSEIDRRGGALLYAAEGQTEVPIRLQVAIENRCPAFAERAPFAWLTPEKLSLKLLDPDSVKDFIARAKAIDAQMRKRFGLPLALIMIDTVIATAGFKKSGDEQDAVLGAQLMQALKEISAATGAFVLGVDHFGKATETGTRGTSAKEDNADMVLATIGERSLEGVVSNPRLAVRKVRGGAAGREFPFVTEIVNSEKLDRKGRQITTLKIKWSEQDATTVIAAKEKKDPWTKSLRLLRRVLMNALVDQGKDLRPYADGPLVRAIDKEIVRREFYKDYPAEGDTQQKKQLARNRALNRAINDAQAAGLIGVREVELVQYLWLLKAGEPT
jgi:AAA domain/CHC2 zinc finger